MTVVTNAVCEPGAQGDRLLSPQAVLALAGQTLWDAARLQIPWLCLVLLLVKSAVTPGKAMHPPGRGGG